MALPLVPFIIGAAAGSLATYLYRDKEVREHWREAAENWYDTLAARWRHETRSEEAARRAAEMADEAIAMAEQAVDKAQEAARAAGAPRPGERPARQTHPDPESHH